MKDNILQHIKRAAMRNGVPVFVFAAASAVVLRLVALKRYYLLDGDSAVFALMAGHIQGLREFPAYMWLNHYAGALVSYIGAFFFAVRGFSSSSYMLSGAVLSLCWVLASLSIARRILPFSGYITAAFFLIVPPSVLLFYSLYPGGVQAETLLFGTLILGRVLAFSGPQVPELKRSFFWLGFCSGCGLWLSPGVFPAVLTALTVLMLRDRMIFLSHKIGVFAAGLAAGFLPGIAHNIFYPGATFFRLGGRFLNVSRGSLENGNLFIASGHGLWRMILMIPGSLAQIPSLTAELLGPVNAWIFFIAGAVVLTAGWRSFIRDRVMNPWMVFLIYAAWAVLFYSAAIRIGSPRYMLGLVVIFPFIAGKMLSIVRQRNKVFFWVILSVILTGNCLSIRQAWSVDRAPRYAELSSWLAQRKYAFGFSDYLTAFPVVFYSQERVMLSPTIFHPSFYDRYPEYTERVRRARDPVYIIDTQYYPSAARQIELGFAGLGVGYRKDGFDRFAVYYGLSRFVDPRELGLSEKNMVYPGGA